MRTCTKCGLGKSDENFFRDKSKKDGISPSCKQCYKKYYSEIRESKLAKKKVYREKNSVKISEYRVGHYIRNKEKAVACASDWSKQNPDRRRAAEASRRARKIIQLANLQLQIFWRSCLLKNGNAYAASDL